MKRDLWWDAISRQQNLLGVMNKSGRLSEQGTDPHRVGEGREGATIDHTECKDNHAFTESVLHWWKVHGSKFPAWAEPARIVFALTPNSAAAERVFSISKAMFGDQATTALVDYIQNAIMLLRSNKRKVG
jgi:hypothetical protein